MKRHLRHGCPSFERPGDNAPVLRRPWVELREIDFLWKSLLMNKRRGLWRLVTWNVCVYTQNSIRNEQQTSRVIWFHGVYWNSQHNNNCESSCNLDVSPRKTHSFQCWRRKSLNSIRKDRWGMRILNKILSLRFRECCFCFSVLMQAACTQYDSKQLMQWLYSDRKFYW